jgi:ribosomal protein S18 acetylase RimI-like enzyme
MEIEIRSPKTNSEWENYYDLRFRVLREPWQQPRGSEKNEGDNIGIHMALFQFGIIKAIARLDVTEENIGQVRFVAVETSNQGKGFGNLIMGEVEKVSIARGDTQMILHAREQAVGFYLNQGYQLVEKSHLLFDKIQHYLMEKRY